MAVSPERCPACGARDSFQARYTTGGGWRRVSRCRECGYTTTAGPVRRAAAVARERPGLAAAAVATAAAAWLYLRDRSR